MEKKPNLLFIFADQMRASAMGCMHDENVKTPNLDTLASEGMLFTNAIANSPVCTPSRASMITGKHALNARCFINDIRLPVDEPSIAKTLNQAGYRSAYIGKWHLDGISRHMFTPPERRHGFDNYWAAYNCHHDYFDTKYYLNDSPELIRVEGYEPEIQTDLAIEYLQEYQGEQPFNLWVSYGTPHAPYHLVPQRYKDMYPPEEIELRPNAISPDREALSGYYAHITALDENVGKLLAELDRLGLRDNTLVVFTSDHGDMLWSHMLQKKQLPFEESIHIPLILRYPGILETNLRSDLLFSVADLAPTLLAVLGVPVPEEMEGENLHPVLVGREAEEPDSVFINNYAAFDQAKGMQPWRGVRTKRYTYARWLQGSVILFDNLNDPYQLENLAIQPEQAPLVDEMETKLQYWLDKVDDPFLTAVEHINRAGQREEWQIREEHFHGGFNF
ncbi:MAG: sulfatase [Anaerolineae bacterium]|jgi:arylsulfatase A-like enzyme|nr:sulfatase [Anaerolineae bacterium]